jgi:hypothetical protein
VRGVALLGGLLQVLLTMVLAGGVASAIGASIHEGVFIGALVRLCSEAFRATVLVQHVGLLLHVPTGEMLVYVFDGPWNV